MVKQASSAPAEEHFQSDPSEPDRSRQRVTEKCQRQEISSTSSTEQQPFKTQREEDQQQEDHRSSPENNIFTEIALEKHDLFKFQDINSWKQFSLELIAYYKSLCLLSIENTNNLHPVTSTTASAQDSQAASVSPNDNSLDGFTYNIGRFTLWLTERLKQTKHDDDDDKKKTDLFIDMMKLHTNMEKIIILSVEAGEPLQSLLDKDHEQHGRVEKQYAFAVVFLIRGKTVISSRCYPRHSTKRSHSEEILIEKLDDFFQNNGANVQHVFIYTHNSPCTKREKAHIEPCMFLLRKKADQWHNEYGFSTGIAFRRFWGQSRPNFFDFVTEIPSPRSAFYPYNEKCERIPFKLDWKDFKLKPGDILNLTDVEVRKSMTRRQDMISVFHSLKGFAETSFGLRTDYLETGGKMIAQSLKKFQDLDIWINISKTLKEKWDEMVNNSFLSLIRETITADFNAAVVHLAVEDLQLGDNSPLKLYHILERYQK
ncbi:uncharacterized protein LOC119007888 isoform X2 [Acanthopagrus latus]|uniref:uncharacterized protein LOC119007888 isoform X2 n=1 Tax=Acanthopagrus latus TaxID=8177 RepID=UPI00187CA8F7|nr:uncharacterized protein LOC119007888 isoform X2 [Acanthopagrus latus]